MRTMLKIREFLYQLGIKKTVSFPALTISVGNISFGGTGKSPTAEWLCSLAQEKNKTVLFLSRGYGRKSNETIVLQAQEPALDAAVMGDEPRMIKCRHPEVTMLIDANRACKAKEHWSECSANWIILDDGFQHWKATRDIDIVLVDAKENFQQATLPFGRLREPLQALRRADLVVLSRTTEVSAEFLELQKKRINAILQMPREKKIWKRETTQPKEVPILSMNYTASNIIHVLNEQKQFSPAFLQKRACILISGIARSKSFRKSVEELGAQVLGEIHFADHQFLRKNDLEKIHVLYTRWKEKNPVILITEKDWARWQQELADFPTESYRINIELQFAPGDEECLRKTLESADACIKF